MLYKITIIFHSSEHIKILLDFKKDNQLTYKYQLVIVNEIFCYLHFTFCFSEYVFNFLKASLHTISYIYHIS